jgi:hypothetical protein
MWIVLLLIMKVGSRYLHMEEMLVGLAVFVVKGRYSEFLWRSCTIGATFSNCLRSGVLFRVEVERQ